MFLTQEQLKGVGFKYIDSTALISDKASIYGADNISIGAYSRVDDFAILSAGDGGIEIGNYVHIACYASIVGGGRVIMENYSGLSSRVAVFSSSDKYDGTYMTNPCIPEFNDYGKRLRNTYNENVYIGKHVVIGTGSTILPGSILMDGCAVGAMTLIRGERWSENSIVVGIPAKLVGARNHRIYNLEDALEKNLAI